MDFILTSIFLLPLLSAVLLLHLRMDRAVVVPDADIIHTTNVACFVLSFPSFAATRCENVCIFCVSYTIWEPRKVKQHTSECHWKT